MKEWILKFEMAREGRVMLFSVSLCFLEFVGTSRLLMLEKMGTGNDELL